MYKNGDQQKIARGAEDGRAVGEDESTDDIAGACSGIRSKALNKTRLGWRFSTSSTGTRSTRSSAMTFWNTGVSRMPSRIHKPIPTMMMLMKNGMRQPQ